MLPYLKAEVIWAVKMKWQEQLRIFSSQSKSFILDAKASVEIALEVAKLMAKELHKDSVWIKNQIEEYTQLAKGYLL